MPWDWTTSYRTCGSTEALCSFVQFVITFETTARTTRTMSEPEACHDEYSDYVEQGLELLRVAYIDGRTIGRPPVHGTLRPEENESTPCSTRRNMSDVSCREGIHSLACSFTESMDVNKLNRITQGLTFENDRNKYGRGD
jgi:hypothetical protein